MVWSGYKGDKSVGRSFSRYAPSQNQLFNRRISITERTQNLPRMLTDLRRHSCFLLWHTLHRKRAADGRDAAELRMLDLREYSVGHHLCIFSYFLHRRDRSPDHALLAEEQVPLGHISAADCLIEQGDHLFAVPRAGLGRGVTRVFYQLLAPDRATNSPPVIGGVD